MAIYVLIGGRSTKFLNDFSLEKKIFNKLNIINPNVLFIPAAAYKDINGAVDKFTKLIDDYLCDVKFLTDLEDVNVIDRLFDWADIIYFGGGTCEVLVEKVKTSPLYEVLLKYQNSNKVYAGLSAGAMLFCNYGMGDAHVYSYNGHIYNYQMVKCLGFLNITICPHYDHDGLDCFNSEVKKYDVNAYALEDDTAILVDDKIRVFKMDKRKSVYLFDKDKNYQMIPLYGE